MVYNFFTSPKNTPQAEVVPGRDREMIKGRSGGVAFKIDVWASLRRCLLLGTANGSYYATKTELTTEFIDVLKEAIALNPKKVADEILYASDGRAINNHAPILALVLLSMGDRPEAKMEFQRIFMDVVRTGSHFHEWANYTKGMRGFGRGPKTAALIWLCRPDVKGLAYQMLKYPQRYGMSFRDELRLFKPSEKAVRAIAASPVSLGIAFTPDHDSLFGYVAGKKNASPLSTTGDAALDQIAWYERLKKEDSDPIEAIKKGRLTFEMVMPVVKPTKEIWQTLFEQMPIGAMLRNLGSLSEIEVIRTDQPANIDLVEQKLCNVELLRKARIHPLEVLKALKTYQSGKGVKGQKTWGVVSRIVDILERSLELSFEAIAPTGKVFLHAVDISGSMTWDSSKVGGTEITSAEVAAVMALAHVKSEKNYRVGGFSREFADLGLTAKDSFSSANYKMQNSGAYAGGTDPSKVFQWALDNKFMADAIIMWTDNESWAGGQHAYQALDKYRRINPNVKVIYVSLVANNISLTDPKDPLSFDIVGFTPAIPRIISQMVEN